MSSKNLTQFTVKSDYKRVSGSKLKWVTCIVVPFRYLESFYHTLADSTAGVAPNTYPNPIY